MTTILPFCYKKVKHSIIDTSYLYQLNWSSEILDKLLLIQSIPCKFKPIWSIKIEDNKITDLEIYFYQYHPEIGEKDLIQGDVITHDVLKTYFPEYDEPFVTDYPMTMLSIDLMNKTNYINYYYLTNTNNNYDEGFSTYDSKLQNVYYRYHSSTPLSHLKYIDKQLLTIHDNEKTLFISDKYVRKLIGCYYDGINQEQYNYYINRYNLTGLPKLHSFQYCSVHIDYDYTSIPKRFGIYGILS